MISLNTLTRSYQVKMRKFANFCKFRWISWAFIHHSRFIPISKSDSRRVSQIPYQDRHCPKFGKSRLSCLQHLIPNRDTRGNYLEFYCIISCDDVHVLNHLNLVVQAKFSFELQKIRNLLSLTLERFRQLPRTFFSQPGTGIWRSFGNLKISATSL